MKRSLAGWGLTVVLAATAMAQAPAAPERLVFEVASVKPAAPGETGGIIRPDRGYQTYVAANVPLRLIMTVAYQVTDRQIDGGPGWVGTDRWDIVAKADRPHTPDELHLMFQHLLEDRFQLKLRHESRQESGYEMAVDKGGVKMTLHDPPDDTDSPPIAIGRGAGAGTATLRGTNVEMNYFAFFLSRTLGQTVTDKTGLNGHYDIQLQFPFDGAGDGAGAGGARGDTATPGGPPPAPDFTPLIAALRGQLGLRLDRAKVAVPYLVITSAAKPAAN